MKRIKRIGSIILIIALVLSLGLTGCTSSETQDNPTVNPETPENEETGSTEDPETEGQWVVDDAPVLRLAEATTCDTLNPHRGTSAQEYERLIMVNGHLYKRVFDTEAQTHKWGAELATDYPQPVDDTNKVWRVEVVQGATYEDGTPITAHSFIYTWKMLLDPVLANRNTSVFFSFEGAQDYYLGSIDDFSQVGIKAIDDYTLEFTFKDEYIPENAQPLMSGLAHVGAGLVHEEMFESCFSEDRSENTYGTTIDRFVASGAYNIIQWTDGQYMEFEKRQNSGHPYVETGFYKPQTVQITAVSEQNTQIQMYENGEIDAVIANIEKYENYPDVFYVYTPSNYGIFINSESTTNPVLQDVNFRYAIYWGMNREEILSAVMPTMRANPYHYSALATILDPNDSNSNLKFRDLSEAKAIRIDEHELTDSGYDPDLAVEYFNKAYEANGNQLIEIEMQYSEGSDTRKTWAEALQDNYQKLFGEDRFKMTLRAVPHATIYENMNRNVLAYDMSCTAGIYQNIEEPWANSNYVYTGPDTYSTQYTIVSPGLREEWDDLYYACTIGRYKFDPQARIEASARMEEILYNDATFLPAYARGDRWLINERIEILMRNGEGNPFLEFALLQATYYKYVD